MAPSVRCIPVRLFVCVLFVSGFAECVRLTILNSEEAVSRHRCSRVVYSEGRRGTNRLEAFRQSSQDEEASTAVSLECRGLDNPVVLSQRSGFITSPGFTTGEKYPKNAKCAWRIEAPSGQMIRLTFREFDLEPHRMCDYDSVSVLDGESLDSESLGGPYCGTSLPPDLLTTGNQAVITFTSDEIVGKDGFQIEYSILPSEDWCRLLSTERLPDPESGYLFHIRVRNINSSLGPNFGQIGLAFNVVDGNNFDFVLIRFRDAVCSADDECSRKCIQFGYVEEGLVVTPVDDQHDCPGRTNLIGGRLYRLSLRVRAGRASLSVNALSPRGSATRFTVRGSVGIIIPMGYDNVIEYSRSQIANL